jgi:hypothetical protein
MFSNMRVDDREFEIEPVTGGAKVMYVISLNNKRIAATYSKKHIRSVIKNYMETQNNESR